MTSNLLERSAPRTAPCPAQAASTRAVPRTALSSSSTHDPVNRAQIPEPVPPPKRASDPLHAAIDRGLDLTISDDPRVFIDRSAQRSGE